MKRESITVLVFKDNFAARAFQLPLNWVSRFGLLIGLLVGVTLLTSAAAVRFYWLARKADPVRVLDLEQEIADLREAQRSKPMAAAPVTPAPTETTAAQTVALDPTAAATATATPAPIPALFGGDLVLSPSVSPTDLPFKLDKPLARWKNGKLEVTFNFLYSKGDGGSQKGRIVILARGEKSIQGYPDGVLQLKETQPVQIDLKPREGEYFSVGRYREVSATFSKIEDPKDIRNAEVLIYDNSLKLLVQTRLTPAGDAPAAAARKQRAAPRKTAPAVAVPASEEAPVPAAPTETAAPAGATTQ